MTSQIQGLNQAVRNATDAISVIQSADGALSSTVNNLQRIRQLAVQPQNGINTQSEKRALNEEAQQLLSEIDRVAEKTKFAGKSLLAGSFEETFAVGANRDQSVEVALTQLADGFNAEGLGLKGLNLETNTLSATGAMNADLLKALDNAISTVGSVRVELGSKQGRFQSSIRAVTVSGENVSNTRSKIMDTDYAKTTAEFTKEQIVQQSTISIMGQANQLPQGALVLLR